MIVKKPLFGLVLGLVFLSVVIIPSAQAHVVVKPAEVTTGSRQTFTMSVPAEGNSPTKQLRLIIPEGLESVRPNVKPGWQINVKKSDDGSKVSEITWTGGTIPTDQRDEFVFAALVPETETPLVWKVYQTMANGQVFAWDQDKETVTSYAQHGHGAGDIHHDESAPKPYSTTQIVSKAESADNENGASAIVPQTQNNSGEDFKLWAVALSALVLSVIAIGLQLKKFRQYD